MTGKQEILKNSDYIALMVEPNMLGIRETKEILEKIINEQKNQKDNVKIVINKFSISSIPIGILKILFFDFEIIGILKYNNFYNFFINENMKYGNRSIDEQYKKIIKKIIN